MKVAHGKRRCRPRFSLDPGTVQYVHIAVNSSSARPYNHARRSTKGKTDYSPPQYTKPWRLRNDSHSNYADIQVIKPLEES